jgi:predicted amidohydrolase YtcJ
MTLIVRRAQVGAVEVDVRIESGRVAAIGHRLQRACGEPELDARHGAVLPGLHDHHLHLRALAAAGRSVVVGPPAVGDHAGFTATLAAAASMQQRGAWLRAVGYHDSVAGELNSDRIDRVVADRPVRIQHRSGALWILNSAGLAAIGADAETAPGIERDERGRLTGRLWRMDAWLADRLAMGSTYRQTDDAALAAVSAKAIAAGVTGWTDATPERSDVDAHALAQAVASGLVRQRLHLMMPATADVRTLDEIERIAGVTIGPAKVLLDDTALPTLDELVALITRAHSCRRPIAVHCVTRTQIVLTVVALQLAGSMPGDRIEHGALIPADLLSELASCGVTVVTQPNFVYERGDDYLTEIPTDDRPDLWRGRSLIQAGVAMAAGSDAPFGSADPWLAVRAAARRRTSSGQLLQPTEAVELGTALSWWVGTPFEPARPRRIEAGERADLVVLAAPLAAALEGDAPVPVAATIIDGEVVATG